MADLNAGEDLIAYIELILALAVPLARRDERLAEEVGTELREAMKRQAETGMDGALGVAMIFLQAFEARIMRPRDREA